MRRFIIVLITLLVLGVGGFFGYKNFFQKPTAVSNNKVKAEDKNEVKDTKEVSTKNTPLIEQQISTNKVWEFGFDKEIDVTTVNAENIKVTDSNGQNVSISTSLTNGNKTIQITPPAEGYKKGGLYNLNIKNGIAYANGTPVSKPFNMKFIVERDEVEKGTYSKKLITVKKNQVKSTNGDSLVVSKDIKKELKINDIIVVPSEKNDVGKALKITSIDSSSGNYTVTVTKPAFSELFEDLDIYKSYSIKPENIELAKGVQGVAIQSISEATPNTMIASSNTPTHNGEYAMPTVNAGRTKDKDGFEFKFSDLKIPLDTRGQKEGTLEGSYTLISPKVDVDVDIKSGKINKFMFSEKGHSEQETKFKFPKYEKEGSKVSEKIKASKEKYKGEVVIGKITIPIPSIPGVFVEGEILMQVKAGISGEPEVTFSVELDNEAGILYENNKTTPTFKFDPDVNGEVKGTAKGEVKAGPTLEAALTALEVVGAGVESFAGLKLTGEFVASTSNKDTLHACINGYVGLAANATGFVETISFTSPFKYRIAEFETKDLDIGEQKINTCNLYQKLIPSQNKVSLNAGEQTNLHVSAQKIDLLKFKKMNEKIKNHKDLKLSFSKQGVAKVEKTESGLVIKALKKPLHRSTTLEITYETKRSSFSDAQKLKVEIPITIKNFDEVKPNLNGKYQGNVGILNIKNDTDNQFSFNLKISGVGNPVDINGTATKTQNIANFTDPDVGCRIQFTINGKSIDVKEQNRECLDLHSLSIDTNGTYTKTNDDSGETSQPTSGLNADERTPKSKKETLTDIGAVPVNYDEEIQKLVGSDYSLLVESTKDYEMGYDLDGLGTDVIKGGRTTTPGKKQSMIMYDSNDYFYVGLIIDGNKVRFYTTNPVFKNQLPKTAEDWSSSFMDYPVEIVYKGN